MCHIMLTIHVYVFMSGGGGGGGGVPGEKGAKPVTTV